jgi:hypothetical protein
LLSNACGRAPRWVQGKASDPESINYPVTPWSFQLPFESATSFQAYQQLCAWMFCTLVHRILTLMRPINQAPGAYKHLLWPFLGTLNLQAAPVALPVLSEINYPVAACI